MSMISSQCDKLRETASKLDSYDAGYGNIASMLREAADTIWQLRDDLQRSNAENAKLRELVQDWYELAVGGADSLTDWNHAQADLEQRMRELGVEVNK